MIENKEIEFDPSVTLNVITTAMLKHDKGVSAIIDVIYVATVSELVTPLLIIKENLLQAGLFMGCIERCYCCEPNAMAASC